MSAEQQPDPWWGGQRDPWSRANNDEDGRRAAQTETGVNPGDGQWDTATRADQSEAPPQGAGWGDAPNLAEAQDWSGEPRRGDAPDASSDGSTADHGTGSWNARRSSDGSWSGGTPWNQASWRQGWRGDWNGYGGWGQPWHSNGHWNDPTAWWTGALWSPPARWWNDPTTMNGSTTGTPPTTGEPTSGTTWGTGNSSSATTDTASTTRPTATGTGITKADYEPRPGGPSEKIMVPIFRGEGEGGELGTSARSYLRQVAAWERMTKLGASQRALVLYQHLQGAAWINAEQLAVDKLSSPDGVEYFKAWVTQHYLDIEVTSIGRSLSDLFRKLKRRPAQTFRDYVAEYNRLSARVAECGCRLPDIASAWLFVDRANLDESTEVSLLASVGNRYNLQQLQQAAIILDRSMRKPWERTGRANTVHMTDEIEDEEEGEEDPVLQDDLGDHDHGDLYVSYMTAKARYKDAAKARGVDVEAVRKTAEQRVAIAKSKSHCAACGQKGHWHRDAICPKNKAGTGNQDPKAHSIHVTNEVFELATAPGGPLLAITDTACSRCVVGAAWLQRYIDDVKAQAGGDGNKAYPYEFINEKESFRFGASRVYESSYAAVILTKVGGTWLAVKAAVIHGDIPLLLSRPLLASLGMMFDVEHNVANFRKINVEGLKLASTTSGHPALMVQCIGSSAIDPSSVPKAWGNKELEILKTRGAYMSFVVGHGEAVLRESKQGEVSEGDRRAVVGNPNLFYAKKISPAIYEALVADSLNMNTFLGWWNSTAITNDFWIETEHKLIRVHVTPRGAHVQTADIQCYGSAAAFSTEQHNAHATRNLVMSTRPAPWKMNKVELQQECARLGIAFHPRWTVPELRHLLSEHNEITPMFPKRLTSMSLPELRAEAEAIGIGYGPKETKGSLMLRIRDAVAPDQTIMTVGRHRGVPYVEIPDNYGAWASEEERVNGTNMHPDLKRYVTWRREKKEQQEDPSAHVHMNQDVPREVESEIQELETRLAVLKETCAGHDTTEIEGGYTGNHESRTRDQHHEHYEPAVAEDHGTVMERNEAIPQDYHDGGEIYRGTTERVEAILQDYHDDVENHNTVTKRNEAIPQDYHDGVKDHNTVTECNKAIPQDYRDDGEIYRGTAECDEAIQQDYHDDGEIYKSGHICQDDGGHNGTASEPEELAHAMVVDTFLAGAARGNRKDKTAECELRAKEALDDEDYIYETLEEVMEMIPQPTRTKHRSVHGDAEPKARHVFGYYAHGGFGGICRRSFEYPNLVRYLNAFLQSQVGDDLKETGEWNAISVLENIPSSVHTDNNNYPGTYNYAVSTGAYVGGELWVQRAGGGVWKRGKGDVPTEGEYVNNYQRAVAIDPKLQHGVEEWGGKRWVLVAYTTRNVMNANPCERKALTEMGFPIPARRPTPHKATEDANTRTMPKRSVRKGLWKRAAELSVLLTTLTNAYQHSASEMYRLQPQRPKTSMAEIGDVTATCYVADVLGENVNLAEPVLWEDYEWWRTTGNHPESEQLWIHIDNVSHNKHGEELESLASKQIRNGGTVVFEDNLSDNEALWKEIGYRWRRLGCEVGEDYTEDGCRLLRVQRPKEEHVVYVGETVDGGEEGDQEKTGAAGITFAKGVSPHIASALKRAHQNLGHPSTADFVRHLRVAGAKAEVLKAAKGLKCETCVRTQAPSISKPAAIASVLQFNQVVGADLLYVHDVNGKKHEMLSVVDFSSSYHIVIPVARKDTATLEQAFCHNWVNVFGAPGTIAVDLENGLQKALARTADWTGMAIRSCAGQAHWQAGFTERQGGLWKAIFNRVAEDKNVAQADIALAVAAVSNAKNTLRKVSGFSPAQHVFGQAPVVAEDLMDGPLAHMPDGEVVMDDKHAREVATRTAARAAFHFVQTDDRVRRALQGRARVQAREPNVGDRVFFFRKAKNSKRGWWRGPATIIGKEANNFWISRAGRCLLCAPEHVRLATNQELGHMFALRAGKEDMDKLLNADFDDKDAYIDEEPEGENEDQDLDMEEVAMENEDMDTESRGVRRAREVPPAPVAKRYRKKAPATEGEAQEILMLKRAKTERSRAKQLEKELPWQMIPEDKRDDFRTAEDKQWSEHMEHDALEILDVERSREVEATVPKARILSSRWAYRDKSLAQRRTKPETPWKCKARLVIGGHEDPDLAGGRVVSDSPTVSRATLILLLQICCSRLWQAAAGDVAAAFLNGVYIQRELYMRQPRGGVRGLDPRQLLRVKKGIFGLTESPRLWYDRLTSVMLGHTFLVAGKEYKMTPCPLDPCVYMLQAGAEEEPIAYVAVHVDDLLVIAKPEVNKCVRDELSKLFPVDDWEVDNFDYIGSHISTENGEILINQEAFVDGRLFMLDIDPKADNEVEATEEQLIDNRSLVGALSWLAGQSRPDLQCGVALAQQRQRAPTVGDLRFTNALTKKATEHRSEGVRLRPIPLEKGIFYAFHDSGWANADEQDPEDDFKLTPEEEDQRTMKEGPPGPGKAKRASSRVASQLGHVIMFGNLEDATKNQTKASLLEWRSQTCQRVCRSTFGAETMACAEGLECGQFLRALLATLLAGKLIKLHDARGWWPIICLTDCRSLHDHLHRAGVPRVPADRRLAVDLAAIRQEFRRCSERVAIQWLPTTCQVADPLTKPMKCREWWRAQQDGIRLPFDVLSKVIGKPDF
ncbi:RE1 [Symbiodinium sp. CCMP2456]|nr:RE1 [Symbiodinium sp. CCMP2456]